MDNIFSALNKYKPQEQINPLENFFTESLKFILNLNTELLNDFVRKISNDKFKLFKAPFSLETQARHDSSIIDLQITDKRKQKIFIEIKVNARENRYFDEKTENDFGQVQKYLDLNDGYVCFIAKDQGDIRVKKHKDKFLGQYEWFEIYKVIDEFYNKNKNKLDKNNKYFITKFLEFMTEQNMQSFQGFSKKDLALAKTNYLEFYGKILDFLKEVSKDKRIRKFLIKHNLKVLNNTPKFSRRWEEFGLDFGRNKWKWHKIISVILFFDLVKSKENNYQTGLYFSMGVGLSSKYHKAFVKNIRKLKIKKIFFDVDPNAEYWVINKNIYFPKFIKAGEKHAITYIYNSLLELERSGVMDVLRKIK